MNIYSEKGISLVFEGEEVLIRIYPGTDILVNIERESALHLYRLVNKYNYTIRNPKKWGAFWRNVSQIERTMTVMFIQNNTYNGWGRKFRFENIENLPQDFAEINAQSRLPKMKKHIEKELDALYTIYMKTRVTKEEIRTYWEKEYANICEVMKEYNQIDHLVESCFEEEKIKEIMTEVFIKKGYSAFEKEWNSWNLKKDESGFNFLTRNAIGLFASTGFQLTRWKDQD